MAATLAEMEGELARLVERAKADGDVDPAWDTATIARFCIAVGVGYTQLDSAGLAHSDVDHWTALIRQLLSSIRPG